MNLLRPRPLEVEADALVSDDAFLAGMGARVRTLRQLRGMTRKALAREADVSERYLAQLETGEGNMSIVLLRRVAAALGTRLIDVLEPDSALSTQQKVITRLLASVPANRLEDLGLRLLRELGVEESARQGRIALIGLRGAGKTSLGERLARDLGVRFVELDGEIERDIGMPLAEVFSLYGQAGFRRFERKTLSRLIDESPRMVLAVGGGIVAEDETYELLRGSCITVWLKARPEEHMARVLAQGDLRPISGNTEAMEDLKRILAARVPLYEKADVVVDTAGKTLAGSYRALREAVHA